MRFFLILLIGDYRGLAIAPLGTLRYFMLAYILIRRIYLAFLHPKVSAADIWPNSVDRGRFGISLPFAESSLFVTSNALVEWSDQSTNGKLSVFLISIQTDPTNRARLERLAIISQLKMSADESQPLLYPRNINSNIVDHILWQRWLPGGSTYVTSTRAQVQRFLTSKTGHYAVLLLVALDVSSIFAGT